MHDCAAFVPGATTLTDALSNPLNAKALRTTASNGSAVLNTTPPNTATSLTDILGVVFLAQGAAHRSGTADRRLEMGYDLAGVQTMGTKAKAKLLITIPPSTLPPPPDSDPIPKSKSSRKPAAPK